MNASHQNVPFIFPTPKENHIWEIAFDTFTPEKHVGSFEAGNEYILTGRSLATFIQIEKLS